MFNFVHMANLTNPVFLYFSVTNSAPEKETIKSELKNEEIDTPTSPATEEDPSKIPIFYFSHVQSA